MTGKPYTASQRRRLFARLAKLSRRIAGLREQAAALGVTLGTLYNLRRSARAAGYRVAPAKAPAHISHGRHGRWDRLVEDMATTCGRCGLRGKHECLSTRVDPHARRPLEMP